MIFADILIARGDHQEVFEGMLYTVREFNPIPDDYDPREPLGPAHCVIDLFFGDFPMLSDLVRVPGQLVRIVTFRGDELIDYFPAMMVQVKQSVWRPGVLAKTATFHSSGRYVFGSKSPRYRPGETERYRAWMAKYATDAKRAFDAARARGIREDLDFR
jgi:hypothetical protein